MKITTKVLSSISLASILFVAILEAAPSYHHKHGKRFHSHPFPAEGISHRHNLGVSKSKPKPVRKTPVSKHEIEWIKLTLPKGGSIKNYLINKTRFKIAKTNSGKAVIVVGGVSISQDNTKKPLLWSVPLERCSKKSGLLSWLTDKGVFIGKEKYQEGEKSTSSIIATNICNSYRYKKGLIK